MNTYSLKKPGVIVETCSFHIQEAMNSTWVWAVWPTPGVPNQSSKTVLRQTTQISKTSNKKTQILNISYYNLPCIKPVPRHLPSTWRQTQPSEALLWGGCSKFDFWPNPFFHWPSSSQQITHHPSCSLSQKSSMKSLLTPFLTSNQSSNCQLLPTPSHL